MISKITKEKTAEAYSQRLSGETYSDIARNVFGVSPRTERGWRQRGQVDQLRKQDSIYRDYFNLVGDIPLCRLSEEDLNDIRKQLNAIKTICNRPMKSKLDVSLATDLIVMIIDSNIVKAYLKPRS